MKNPISIKTSSLSVRTATLLLATLIVSGFVSGCATRRPSRQSGPPPMPVMPPKAQTPVNNLPPQSPVIFTPPVVEISLPPVAAVSQQTLLPRKGTSYTVKKGESLSAIAARNKMSWRNLAEYNYITDPNKVLAGQVILIPFTGTSIDTPNVAPDNTSARVTQPPAPANSGNTYVVQSGDSLSVIARRYSTSVSDLKGLNGLRSDRLLVGQILKLPTGSEAARPTSSRPSAQATARPTPAATRRIPPLVVDPLEFDSDPLPQDLEIEGQFEADQVLTRAFTIIVQKGNTLESIANTYIVPVEEIRKLNNLGPNAVLKEGQNLQIPPGIY